MKKSLKYMVLVVMVVSVLSSSVLAMENTNKYISSCGAYINTWGDGDISVEFHVFGTDIMDTIGAHRVTVFRVKGETPNAAHDDIVARPQERIAPCVGHRVERCRRSRREDHLLAVRGADKGADKYS